MIKQKINRLKEKIYKTLKIKYYSVDELRAFKECREQGIVFIKNPYTFGLKVLGLGVIGIVLPILPATLLIPFGIYLITRAYLNERKKTK